MTGLNAYHPTEVFVALMAQLKGTENRSAVERMRYNEKVFDYNKRLKKMPGSIIAGMYGLTEVIFRGRKGIRGSAESEFYVIKDKTIQNSGKLGSSLPAP